MRASSVEALGGQGRLLGGGGAFSLGGQDEEGVANGNCLPASKELVMFGVVV